MKELLESQFERNITFRSKIVALSAENLRSKPIGRDRLGHTYWLTKDNDCNFQIYQEHCDEEIWRVVATNREEFVSLIENLKNNEKIVPIEDMAIIEDEDDTTNSTSTFSENTQKLEVQLKDELPEESINTLDNDIKMKDDEDENDPAASYDFVQKVPNLRIKLNNGRNSDMLNTDLTIIDASSELPLRLLKSPSIEEQSHIDNDNDDDHDDNLSADNEKDNHDIKSTDLLTDDVKCNDEKVI